jgi:nucleoside-diphosphate-sugar epimerase
MLLFISLLISISITYGFSPLKGKRIKLYKKKAKEVLGWQPEYVLKDMVKITVEGYEKQSYS